MSERIDHAAEAREWIDAAARHPGAISTAILAQAEATLALVEQQRIANLIALADANHMSENYDHTVEASREAAHALISFAQRDPDDEFPGIHPDIAAALGIEEDPS